MQLNVFELLPNATVYVLRIRNMQLNQFSKLLPNATIYVLRIRNMQLNQFFKLATAYVFRKKKNLHFNALYTLLPQATA